MSTFKSDVSQTEFPLSDRISAGVIRPSLLVFIQKEYPKFSKDCYLSVGELNFFREKFIAQVLLREMGELNELEQTVLVSLSDQTLLTDKIEEKDTQKAPSIGQLVADKVATFGGSWTFIIAFGTFIVIWIAANIIWLANKGFDPYPFILLNLILSCLAALQAPVIMMSQNRQEEKDRERAKKDYMVNLKSELEIRILHEKLDHLIMHQQQELLEIQKTQIDLMNDILRKIGPTAKSNP